MNAARTDAHAGAELEQLEADGCDRGIGKLGVAQRDAAHCIDQDVGDRRKPQTQLIGRHRGRGGAIGPQLELLTDAVFGLAARAVEVFVERAGVAGGTAQRGDNEARVGALRGMLGLADDASASFPTSPRLMAATAGPRMLPAVPWMTAAAKTDGKSGRSPKINSAKVTAAVPIPTSVRFDLPMSAGEPADGQDKSDVCRGPPTIQETARNKRSKTHEQGREKEV